MATNCDKISLNLLKFITKSALLCVQVIGIWPYRYDRKSKSFHTTKLLSCYTVIVMLFVFFAYIFAIKNIKVNDDVRVHIPSSTARLTTILLSFMILAVYSISSAYLSTNYNSIIEWLKKSRKVLEKIHHFRNGYAPLPFLRPVLYFILKVVAINGLVAYASIGILSNLISDRAAGKPWLIAFYILPNVSLTVICDIFYGSMLTTTYYYRLLNHHLRNVVGELHSNASGTSLFMENLGHFIDQVDHLAILHLDVTTCTRFMNRIFSVHLMCFMACELLVFISKLFIIYVIFEFEWRRKQTVQFNYLILWYNAVVFVVPFWSMCLLSHSCHTAMKESEKTADILFPISVNKQIDTRFRQSMDAFCLQLANNKLRLTVCGLYIMDHTVLYSIIASAVSYAFILINALQCVVLIQFELTEDHHNLFH